MATNAEILAELEAAAATRRAGGMVESYTLPNGLNIRSTTALELDDLIQRYRDRAAADTAGRRFRLSRTRPAS